MGLSDIILGRGEVIVILSDSTLGIVSAGKALNFGIVQSVNQLTDKVTVGQSVMFDVEKSTPFMIISGQIFYRVNENDISFSEPEEVLM